MTLWIYHLYLKFVNLHFSYFPLFNTQVITSFEFANTKALEYSDVNKHQKFILLVLFVSFYSI